MKLISSLSVFILYFLISCTDIDNPLYGKWSFVNGNSNENTTFINEKNREKVFDKNNNFYISNKDKNERHITIKGVYEIIDEYHFKEDLGNGIYATYEFHILNDTLRFEGLLNIPLDKKKGYRTVFVKEAWVKN